MQSFDAGTLAGAGSFHCEECGYAIALQGLDEIPPCPRCEGGRFRRSSLFADRDDPEPVAGIEHPGWLDQARESLEQPGHYIAYEDGESIRVVALSEDWTRIGRSLTATIRFDDPTISRRHAMVALQDDGVRLLDDRSLNGVFLNGERIDLAELSDGDEIVIGRFHLYYLCPTAAESATEGDLATARG